MQRILDTFMTPRRVDSLITVQEQQQYDARGSEGRIGDSDGPDGAGCGRTARARAGADAQCDVGGDDGGSNHGEGNTTLDFAPRARRTPFAASKRMTPGRKVFRSIGTPKSATPAKLAFSPARPTRLSVAAAQSPRAAVLEAAEEPEAVDNDDDDDTHEAVNDEDVNESVNDDDHDNNDDETKYEIKRLLSHRWATPYSLEIEVEWTTLETTWEPERALHEDCPALLLAHWAARGGRPANPEDPNLFEVLAIRRHSGDRRRFLVEWVGYPPGEASWLSREALEETDGDIVTEYWDRVDAERGKKRGRGRGRRKKVNLST